MPFFKALGCAALLAALEPHSLPSPPAQQPETPSYPTHKRDCNQLDVMFLQDVSASMIEELAATRQTAVTFVREISAKYTAARFGISVYGLPNQAYQSVHHLTSDYPSLLRAIQNIKLTSGSNEYAGEAVRYALREEPWRADALKIIFLITDEPAEEGENMKTIVTDAPANIIGIISYDPTNPNDTLLQYWKRQGLQAVYPLITGTSLAHIVAKSVDDACARYSHDGKLNPTNSLSFFPVTFGNF